ncbi:MAG TPA: DUF445 family protein [Candidatus Sumerlaeota bacterium]|nr:MAG: hypothetical protein BWZ08_01606 [candidate division BRC1 bacterium ADurb.BinA292]HOE96395.1 DUF445 family protein [Candidatus Sumerlaeota bacterium]HOR29221.1 DUF445 family protein [Candidatus Sumerlaeota bacterium]HPK01626.1 DUF445 family protein [Candidatus Sumerlaeota bacterium]
MFELTQWQDWARLAMIPVVGGLIGWATNWLAVKMIFRPRRPRRILGFTLQGLVPKRQRELAVSIGQTVERHLISHDDIESILLGQRTQDAIDGLVRDKFNRFVDRRLRRLNPLLGVMLRGELRRKVERLLVAEARRLAPRAIGQVIDRLEDELDFGALVEEKVRQFDVVRLETIIFEIARRELKAIEVLGGVLGFLIGLLQMAILLI